MKKYIVNMFLVIAFMCCVTGCSAKEAKQKDIICIEEETFDCILHYIDTAMQEMRRESNMQISQLYDEDGNLLEEEITYEANPDDVYDVMGKKYLAFSLEKKEDILRGLLREIDRTYAESFDETEWNTVEMNKTLFAEAVSQQTIEKLAGEADMTLDEYRERVAMPSNELYGYFEVGFQRYVKRQYTEQKLYSDTDAVLLEAHERYLAYLMS